jgi:hypothetical protein
MRSLLLGLIALASLHLRAHPASFDASPRVQQLDAPRIASLIEVEVHQTEPGQIRTAELRELRGRAPGRVVASQTLTPDHELSRNVRFEQVARGHYLVTVKGSQPTEVAAVDAIVDDVPRPPLHLQILPFTLRIRTGIQGESTLILRNSDFSWETRLLLNPEGSADLSLWQGGRMIATVLAREHAPYRQRRTIEALDSEWALPMPEARVTGTVIDAESGAPIAGAGVALDMHSSGDHQSDLMVRTTTNAEGAFEFRPVLAGEHRLSVGARGFPVQETVYEFEDGEERKTLTIRMGRKPSTELTVLDATRRPIPAADVFVFAGARLVEFTRTGTTGTVPVYIEENGERVVYVLPQGGSLGVATIRAGAPPVRLMVPAALSTVIVRAETPASEPIAGLVLDVRYNGQLLPVEVMEALHSRGSTTVSAGDGRIVLRALPTGVYEFLPVGKATQSTPTRLHAQPGENLVVMTFAPKKTA